jgi:hypothetical protein
MNDGEARPSGRQTGGEVGLPGPAYTVNSDQGCPPSGLGGVEQF